MDTLQAPSSFDLIHSYFKHTHPDPSSKDLHTQAADYLSATTSFLLLCQEIGSSSPAREELGFAVNVVDFIQRRVRSSSQGIELTFEDVDQDMLARTLCVQINACIGLAHMLEIDLGGALNDLVESQAHCTSPKGQTAFPTSKVAS